MVVFKFSCRSPWLVFRLHDGGDAVIDVIEVAAMVEEREGSVFGLVSRVR